MQCLKQWLSNYVADVAAIDVADVRIDSRQVQPSDVFVAIPGLYQNGERFIDNAIAAGAVAVLVDSHSAVEAKSVPVCRVKDLAKVLPVLLDAFYRPTAHTKLVGITGTNGKTTISQLIAQCGELLGSQVAVIGTMGAGRLYDLKEMNNTTPGIDNNYRLISEFARQGCGFVAMEVSSQGLAQGRVAGLQFDSCLFTNLTQDHLDYHGDMASYAAAKKTLFEHNPDAGNIINIDDATGRLWYQEFAVKGKTIAVGQYDSEFVNLPHVMFDDVEYRAQGLAFTLKSRWGEATVQCPLFGRFNLYNLLTVMALYLSYGIELQDLVDVLPKLEPVPGRMERFGEQGVVAIVDYAHTPDALKAALEAVKAHVSGKLWCIFGCGGDRDQSKRPLMAQMAERYADAVVITNDNPRHESPQLIVEHILQGITHKERVSIELDRKKAIGQTLKKASRGDIVVIAGKGHETYQVFGDEVIEYDERGFVQQYFAENFEELAS